MSDAWCDWCHEQGHDLHQRWDGVRYLYLCEPCNAAFEQDREPDDEWEYEP